MPYKQYRHQLKSLKNKIASWRWTFLGIARLAGRRGVCPSVSLRMTNAGECSSEDSGDIRLYKTHNWTSQLSLGKTLSRIYSSRTYESWDSARTFFFELQHHTNQQRCHILLDLWGSIWELELSKSAIRWCTGFRRSTLRSDFILLTTGIPVEFDRFRLSKRWPLTRLSKPDRYPCRNIQAWEIASIIATWKW